MSSGKDSQQDATRRVHRDHIRRPDANNAPTDDVTAVTDILSLSEAPTRTHQRLVVDEDVARRLLGDDDSIVITVDALRGMAGEEALDAPESVFEQESLVIASDTLMQMANMDAAGFDQDSIVITAEAMRAASVSSESDVVTIGADGLIRSSDLDAAGLAQDSIVITAGALKMMAARSGDLPIVDAEPIASGPVSSPSSDASPGAPVAPRGAPAPEPMRRTASAVGGSRGLGVSIWVGVGVAVLVLVAVALMLI